MTACDGSAQFQLLRKNVERKNVTVAVLQSCTPREPMHAAVRGIPGDRKRRGKRGKDSKKQEVDVNEDSALNNSKMTEIWQHIIV